MEISIGIDVGKSGALAIAKKGNLKVYNMPASSLELFRLLQGLKEIGQVTAFVEKVSAFVGEEEERRFGIIKMLQQAQSIVTVLEVLEIKTVMLPPATWQSRLKLNKVKGLDKKERKRLYFDFATVWAPKSKFTLRQADAVCLLACGLKLIKERDPLVTGEPVNPELF